jgi:superfamily II DNA/RNA helicase
LEGIHEIPEIQGDFLTLRFEELDLGPRLKHVIAAAGFETCTPIQEMVLPDALAGHDIIGVAKTGTGKTLAFLIPIFEKLVPGDEPQALIVCPTRELALQVGAEAEKIGGPLGVRCEVLYGGTSTGDQKQQLLAGLDVIVGTPGRLYDFISSAYLPTKRLRWLVLDEADRMLDMGFIDEVDRIIRRVPMSRQTMLFSATVPAEVAALAQRYTLYPKEFRVDTETRVPEKIEQVLYGATRHNKLDILRALLKIERPHKALIFTAKKDATSEIARRLRADGHEVYPMSSNLKQADRERVFRAFRDGTTPIVVATDVAARGIDIDDISHVINFDLPMEPQDYVHRIGRTGRAERGGRAISLVEPRDGPTVKGIEKLIGHTFVVETFPGFENPALDTERDGGRPRRRGGRTGGAGGADRHRRSSASGHGGTRGGERTGGGRRGRAPEPDGHGGAESKGQGESGADPGARKPESPAHGAGDRGHRGTHGGGSGGHAAGESRHGAAGDRGGNDAHGSNRGRTGSGRRRSGRRRGGGGGRTGGAD